MAMTDKERFCSQCGVSLIPLDVSHISSGCSDCGKTRFFIRLGDDGKGLKVEKGENITVKIPPMSLKPGPAKFFKPGLSMFLRMILYPMELRSRSIGLETILKSLEEQFDAVHRSSHVLADLGIDYDNPPAGYDFQPYFDAITGNEAIPERWAFHGSLLVGVVREELESGNIEQAMVAMHSATRCAAILCMFGDIEDTLWRGYLWNQKVFEVSGVPVGDPAKIEALEILASRLQSLSAVALYDLSETDQISSKIEVPHLSETEIKNVISYVMDTKKQNKEEAKDERKFKFDKLNMWATVGAGLLGAIIGAVLG
jgi:hypothetical protein